MAIATPGQVATACPLTARRDLEPGATAAVLARGRADLDLPASVRADRLVSINRDLYYGIFIGAVFALLRLVAAVRDASPRAVLTHNWRAGIAIGLLFVGAMAAIVLNEPATHIRVGSNSRQRSRGAACSMGWQTV